MDLKKQLREKEVILTDTRLEALTTAHQLESLKDAVSRMRVMSRFVFSEQRKMYIQYFANVELLGVVI
jgi:hypothetical protein